MKEFLVLKTGALGDVLRTTSILPGLHERYPDARVTWVTAPGAVDLVRLHPLVARVEPFDPASPAGLEEVGARLGRVTRERLFSLDDEELCCRLASRLPTKRLSGAWFDETAMARAYTPDVAPWFDMGLLSTHGKLVADRLKLENTRSHPQIYAEMLGLPMGRPQLVLDPGSELEGDELRMGMGLDTARPVIGLNTGAGGRWISKALPVDRTVALALELHEALQEQGTFLLFGGPDEETRNLEIAAQLAGRVRLIDTGTHNPLLRFAAYVSLCDVLVTSDSLALHVGVARGVRVVAFFAPTSAAEIELYGRGEKVVSTSPDAGSYRADADTSTLTVQRLRDAVLRQLPPR
jgi:heptosyltransferase-2